MNDKPDRPTFQESHLLTVGPSRRPKSTVLIVPPLPEDDEEKIIGERLAAFEKDGTTLDPREAIARVQQKLKHPQPR